ncbi:MAG TPA: cation:proton antiporter [Ignavibacteriaceae bacterium]|nr:cation:proton antiporter [Ignavibacteriaceae bacterium]
MQLTSENIVTFLLSISLMLLSAKLLGELFNKIGQPAVVGEIVAGIILGPTVFGSLLPYAFNWLFPQNNEVKVALDGIVNLAVILLLLVSGLEVDLSVVMKEGKTAFLTGAMGIIVPFSLGFTAAYFFPDLLGIKDDSMKLAFALFMGIALSISALPVIVKTLMDLGIFKTEIGFIIVAAAMFNDIVGWLIFSVILGMIGVNNHGLNFQQTLIYLIAFTLFVLLIFRKIINKVLPWIQKNLNFPGGVLNFILILGFLSAAFTEYIGVHAIFGSFIMGIAIGDSVHIKEKTREIIQQFITNIFAPLFFVSIGLTVNFITNFNFLIVAVILIFAFFGKVIGCGIGARLAGLNKNDSLAVGFGMNSRGAMEIILGILAFQYGLIHADVFVALVIMALITSVSSAPFMKYFLKERENLLNILSPNLILFTNSAGKNEVIGELVSLIGKNLKLSTEKIYNEVIERENSIPTGIANYLAIPHARVDISKPAVAIALNKEGINFEASDGTPSRIIFLLLTPKNKNELQLKLLVDIVNKFKDKQKVEELLHSLNPADFISKLKQL